MDVFAAVVQQHGEALEGAVVHAAQQLGALERLGREPASAASLARALGADPHRVRIVLGVLCGLGLLEEVAGVYRRTAVPVPPTDPMPEVGWGALAEVVRSGRPLDPGDPAPYQRHLTEVGRASAEALARRFPAARVLDLGGGLGTYARAWLRADPAADATVVDRPDIVALAEPEARLTFVAGDVLDVPLRGQWPVVLLSNVLHLHGPETCRQLLARAATWVAPRGRLLVKDVRPGTRTSRLFAVSMALYTDAGDVWTAEDICDWVTAAGLVPNHVDTPDPWLLITGAPHADGA